LKFFLWFFPIVGEFDLACELALLLGKLWLQFSTVKHTALSSICRRNCAIAFLQWHQLQPTMK
jgi:hypothetical protein